MAPIEVMFGALVLLFMLIGLGRGFLRELGVTTVMVFVLFLLNLMGPTLNKGLDRVLGAAAGEPQAARAALIECWIYVVVVIAAAVVSYQGETLAFAGQPPRGAQGAVLGLLIGLINGYLIVGSIWYYMDKFNYPIQWLGFSGTLLSSTAKAIIPLLPITLLGQPVLFGQGLLLYLAALLIVARVIR